MNDSIHLVCPNCDTVIRIPAARYNENPKCGKCHRALFTAHSVELTGANFQRHLGRNDIPVLVDFWAPWCGPCKTMAPQFELAAAQLEPRVRLAKVNTEKEQSLGAQYSIRSIPTLALFLQGRELARKAGAMSAANIVHWVSDNNF